MGIKIPTFSSGVDEARLDAEVMNARMLTAGAALGNYSEGTWTPAFSYAGDRGGFTYNHQIGYWMKFGNMVAAFGHVSIPSDGSGSGTLWIEDFPFNSARMFGASAGVVGDVFGFTGLTGSSLTILAIPGEDIFSVAQNVATGSTDVTNANVTVSGSSLTFAAIYLTMDRS